MKTTIDQLYSDIWHYVFEYFNATELFFSFINVTRAANEVLFNNDCNFYFRGLRLDNFVELLPEKLQFCRIISLEIHQGNILDVIQKCSVLRSLKLIGEFEWIVSLLARGLSENIQLERLILVTSGIGSLHVILGLIGSMCSLRQLEIYGNEVEKNIEMNSLLMNQTRIELFTLHSCSSISWNDLLDLLPALSNIHYLDATLFQESKNNFFPFTFRKLRNIRLMLLEISFNSLIRLITTTPFLTKLILTGLVDAEGYVVNHQWISLFDLCPSLSTVRVNLSLEEGKDNFRKETIRTTLYEVNLNLSFLDDDCDHYVNEASHQRWWKLSGVLNRYQHLLRK